MNVFRGICILIHANIYSSTYTCMYVCRSMRFIWWWKTENVNRNVLVCSISHTGVRWVYCGGSNWLNEKWGLNDDSCDYQPIPEMFTSACLWMCEWYLWAMQPIHENPHPYQFMHVWMVLWAKQSIHEHFHCTYLSAVCANVLMAANYNVWSL